MECHLISTDLKDGLSQIRRPFEESGFNLRNVSEPLNAINSMWARKARSIDHNCSQLMQVFKFHLAMLLFPF